MLSLILLAATLGVAAPSPALPQAQPQFVRPKGISSQQPLWVPLGAAITSEGTLRADAFPESFRASLSSQVLVSPEKSSAGDAEAECQGATAVFDQFPPAGPDKTLADLAQSAARVASGTVRATTVGFFEGTAGTLLEVAPDDQIKGHFSASSIYIFYPYARHREGRVTVCRSDPRYTLRPVVGDHVLFFALYPSRDAADSLFEPGPNHFMIETSDGRLSTTRPFRDASAPASFQDAVTRVRRMIEAETR